MQYTLHIKNKLYSSRYLKTSMFFSIVFTNFGFKPEKVFVFFQDQIFKLFQKKCSTNKLIIIHNLLF